MKARSIALKAAFSFLTILLCASLASAAEVKVATSGGFSAALKELAPEFERATGNKIVFIYGPSMGSTAEAIPARLQRGEAVDVVVLVDSALVNLIKRGDVSASSRVELARSGVGVAVRTGAPRPDISTAAALKQTLLKAKSVAYSDSASGRYVSTELYQRLGIADQMKAKSRMIPAEPVGKVVARGEAEIGFQQISELRPVQGIDLVGPLPPEVQLFTVFSAGVATKAKETVAAQAFIKFLASPKAAPAITKSGMEPITSAR